MSRKINIPSMENIMDFTEQCIRERHEEKAQYVMTHIDKVDYSREYERVVDLGLAQLVVREGQYCDRRRYAVKGTLTLRSGKKNFKGQWFGWETVTVYPDGTESESWIRPHSVFVDAYDVRCRLQ